MDRDGKAQYDLLSTQLQAAVYASYKAEHWVTGCSSPWVQSYEVSMNGDNAVVTYIYATSEGPSGPPKRHCHSLKKTGSFASVASLVFLVFLSHKTVIRT